MQIFILFWAILFLLRTSGCIVRNIIGFVKDVAFEEKENRMSIDYDTLNGPVSYKNVNTIRDYTGTIIGKCENILIFIFIIFDQYTALALIFTAKTVVRAENIRADPLYYLAGTMINVAYSIIIVLFIKYLLTII